jgi:hypothetical protein
MSINSLGAIPVSTDRLAIVYKNESRPISFFRHPIPQQYPEYP